MQNQFKLSFGTVVLIAIFACLFISCSDSNTGVNPENPPNIPQLGKITLTPDLSYFKIDSSTQPESNFQHGKEVIQRALKIVDNAKIFYEVFLKPAISKKPIYKNNEWLWIYKSNSKNSSITQLKLTAKKKKNKIIWQLNYSDVNGKEKNSPKKILYGTETDIGKLTSGHWRMYLSADSTIQLAYKFKSHGTKNVKIIHKPSNVSKVIRIGYLVSTAHYRVYIANFKKKYYGVNWNTKTGKGYVVVKGKKMCWDAHYQNIKC